MSPVCHTLIQWANNAVLRGGRGRSGLLSSRTWHITNEDLLTEGEEKQCCIEGRKREERVIELENTAHHK